MSNATDIVFDTLKKTDGDSTGLVPVIVQDVKTKDVLMLGFTDAKAFELTKSTKRAHFWSRSRSELWLKGETSGNYLDIVDIRLDCDKDTLLYLVNPAGPTCHLGTTTCFD